MEASTFGIAHSTFPDTEVSEMLARLSAAMGTTIAVALVVVGLWGWASASKLVDGSDKPALALWSIRSAAVAALAGAQVLGLTCLVGSWRGRDRSAEVMKLVAGAVCTAALIGCLGLAILSK
jgi:small ligand-binding sensory domain FIST